MVDAVGGVTLTPVQTVAAANAYEGEETTLDGDEARAYVSNRDTSYLTSSLDRQERQKQFVQAYVHQVLASASGNPTSIINLFNTMGNYSTTNLGISEVTYLATVVLGSGSLDLDIVSLQGEMVQGYEYAEYYLSDDSVMQTVLDTYYVCVD